MPHRQPLPMKGSNISTSHIGYRPAAQGYKGQQNGTAYWKQVELWPNSGRRLRQNVSKDIRDNALSVYTHGALGWFQTSFRNASSPCSLACNTSKTHISIKSTAYAGWICPLLRGLHDPEPRFGSLHFGSAKPQAQPQTPRNVA